MAKYASGKRSLAISDRSGMAFPYDEMVKEWNGSLVHNSEYESKQPQIRRRYAVSDAIALQNPRNIKFQQPDQKFLADGDGTFSDSGGASVGVANLTLPGDFAFQTFTTEINTNGLDTSQQSMEPRDPSLQNRRRQATCLVNPVTVDIS
jgi:hypothetical protein|tara:strand:- start:553 stop:999 length:447 start_codon:yes stop_codon:yes gene_type:complete